MNQTIRKKMEAISTVFIILAGVAAVAGFVMLEVKVQQNWREYEKQETERMIRENEYYSNYSYGDSVSNCTFRWSGNSVAH